MANLAFLGTGLLGSGMVEHFLRVGERVTIWNRTAANGDTTQLRELLPTLGVADRCRGLLDSYKEEAVRCLADLENASMKGLLRRVISKIFTIEVKGWCSEFEARNAASRQAGPQTVG